MIGRILSIPTALLAFCAMAATPQTSEACWKSTSHHYCYYTPVYTHWCHHHWWPHWHVTASQATVIVYHKPGTALTSADAHLAAGGDAHGYSIYVTNALIPVAGPKLTIKIKVGGNDVEVKDLYAGETRTITP